MRRLLTLILLVLPGFLFAWETPERGTDLRSDLVDALRPHAEQVFGAPVVFVISDLRVDGNVGFGDFQAVRPDGREITLNDILPRHRPYFDADLWGGADIQALFVKSGRTWVAVDHAIAATDVWWADPFFCPTWGAVIPEVCP